MALLKAFNPHEMSADLVREVATGRTAALDKIMSTVRDNLNAPIKHHLIVSAPRGYGKSFFLRYVEITIIETADRERLPLAMALLSEELPHVKEPDTLIAEIKRTFLKAPADTVGVRWAEDDGTAWEEAIAELDAAIDQRFGSRRGLLVVGVENFDVLIGKAFGKSVQSARLRSLLTRANGRIMLLAASARGAIDRSYDAPLFQAFEEVVLAAWSVDDVAAFLDAQRRASGKAPLTDPQRARARAVATFISGTPRLATLIGDALLDDDPVQAAELLDKLIDELTPYYKERVDILPARSQLLLDALLRGGEPCSATELAHRVNAPAQSAIAAPLDDLKKDLLISGEKASDSAEILLRVTDRVFAHYYRKRVLSHGEETCPLESLVDLLAVIYSPEEKKLQAERFAARGFAREAAVMERLWQADQEQIKLKPKTAEVEGTDFHVMMAEYYRMVKEGRLEERLSLVDRAIALARSLGNSAHEMRALRARVWTLYEMNRLEEALATARDVATVAENASNMREQAAALELAAMVLQHLGLHEESLSTARDAAAKAASADSPKEQASALERAARVLEILERHEEALTTARDASAKAESVGDTLTQAFSLGLAALALKALGRSEEAFTTVRDAADKAQGVGGLPSIAMTVLRVQPPDAAWALQSYRELLNDEGLVTDWPATFFNSIASIVTEQKNWPGLVMLLQQVPDAADQIRNNLYRISTPGRVIAASYDTGKPDEALAQARHLVTALARAIDDAPDPRLARLWREVIAASATAVATAVDNAEFLTDVADILTAHPQMPANATALMTAAAAYQASGRDPTKLARLDPDLATTLKTVFPPAGSSQQGGSKPRRRKKRRG